MNLYEIISRLRDYFKIGYFYILLGYFSILLRLLLLVTVYVHDTKPQESFLDVISYASW